MEKNMKITFYSGVETVTGANFLFESPSGMKVLIDCGMVQGDRTAMEENNEPFSYDISSISSLLITHAHLDHVGRIPKLVKEGYKGPIYSTPETRALAELILNDAVGILTMEAKENGVEPLYNQDDVKAIFPLWQEIKYHEQFKLADDVSILFKDAGHILGSAMIEITYSTTQNVGGEDKLKSKNKILFTGDLGNSPSPLLRDSEAVGDVDYLVIESVYGDRNHDDKDERVSKFEKIIKDTIARGGTLVIPAFSMDRTQVLLYELNNMVERNLIPRIPVFLDSPLAIKVTEIYKNSPELFNDKVQEQIRNGDDIFSFPRLEFTLTQNESRDIGHVNGPKIIFAGSGMSMGGRVISHEGKYLPDPKSTILLVGYQTSGSLGRRLAEGAKKVNIHGESVKVKATIETLYGYSAHRDSDHLVEFVSTGTDKLKQVFVVMGEPRSEMHLAQRINDELGVKAIVPELIREYKL